MNFTWTLFVLSCFLSYTYSHLTNTEVQRGAEASLCCSVPPLLFPVHISWFHMNDDTTQICSMLDSKSKVTFYSGAHKEKYTVTLNNSTTCLTIKKVDYSDSGLYFCGEKMTNKSVIFTATFLKIQENNTKLFNPVIIPVMSGVIVLLVLLVGGLILKIHQLSKGYIPKREEEQEDNKNLDSTELTYAKIYFQTNRTSDKELQPNVLYEATR
ncbi:uncharacterized protein LOC110168516 [Boleophthalmus pectinirostris]|uniref:uncharacterized protein LOC110168516 n=1 Tax=Boleophthalmus pectinirostris TaxID=150288 RepID=UPI002432D089|nr:uncharacterized protein LOC110168516 [Boleophthalmus pectinirostris]XP_055012032.1 uncharacterized protein LOC110168516 [Boleophthalmus pectinirostris]XP_055012033.1 uncharacterized protein LOC110168516 [Boleophthalmus pectinirostris]